MKQILTLVFILFLLKAGAQTSVTAVSCGQNNYFVRVTFTDDIVPVHDISTTVCADNSVHTDTEEGEFLKCNMELFADAACTLPISVDPRFFEFARDVQGSTGTMANPSFIYSNNCSATIPPGLVHGNNYRIDNILIYIQQCIWECSGSGYYNCYSTDPGWPSDFNIMINCCFGPSSLAVHLVSFEGEHSPGLNKLSWQFENKQDFSRLEIERSFDGLRYDPVYATTDVTISTYIDGLDNTAYYRLKIYNTNGTFFISVAVVLKTGSVIWDLKVSPSPFKDVLQVSVSSPVKSLSVFKLCSMEGKTVFAVSRELKAGVNNLIINIPPVCKGVYILTMSNREGTFSRKIVKQ